MSENGKGHMMMPNTDIQSYIFHSNSQNGLFIDNPDPYHLGGTNRAMTDFGTGFYLSDDQTGSYVWGARFSSPSEGTLNVYDIYDSIYDLDGLILSDDPESILRWAITTGTYLGYQAGGYASSSLGYVEDKYLVDVDQYDWIVSRRTDDKMFDYLGSFFDGWLSFRGLEECYNRLSFGDELVLKTYDAINCIKLDENNSSTYDKAPYIGQYESIKSNANAHFQQILREYPASDENIGIKQIIALLTTNEDWTNYV